MTPTQEKIKEIGEAIVTRLGSGYELFETATAKEPLSDSVICRVGIKHNGRAKYFNWMEPHYTSAKDTATQIREAFTQQR